MASLDPSGDCTARPPAAKLIVGSLYRAPAHEAAYRPSGETARQYSTTDVPAGTGPLSLGATGDAGAGCFGAVLVGLLATHLLIATARMREIAVTPTTKHSRDDFRPEDPL